MLRSLRIDLRPGGLSDQTHPVTVDEGRQGGLEIDRRHLDRNAGGARGARDDEQRLAQRARSSVAGVGDVHQDGFLGGSLRLNPLQLIPTAECDQHAEQHEDADG